MAIDLSDVSQPAKRSSSPGLPCSIAALESHLDEASLANFHRWMYGSGDEPGWTADEIFETLLERGAKVGWQTINRHRARKCRCFR